MAVGPRDLCLTQARKNASFGGQGDNRANLPLVDVVEALLTISTNTTPFDATKNALSNTKGFPWADA